MSGSQLDSAKINSSIQSLKELYSGVFALRSFECERRRTKRKRKSRKTALPERRSSETRPAKSISVSFGCKLRYDGKEVEPINEIGKRIQTNGLNFYRLDFRVLRSQTLYPTQLRTLYKGAIEDTSVRQFEYSGNRGNRHRIRSRLLKGLDTAADVLRYRSQVSVTNHASQM